MSSDDTCPGCGALDDVQPQPAPPTVQAWSCTACCLHWCTTVVNPALGVALAVIGLLPTPQQRTAALLDLMRVMAIRWGLSILDWQSHAIDERRMHPVGVYKAECGHLLMMVVQLHEQPYGRACEACAGKQFARAVMG